MSSILSDVKDILGIDHANVDFDASLIMDINATFMVLTQMGVGPSTGYEIDGENDQWTDFLQDILSINALKTYVGLKVREMFDPPSSSVLGNSLSARIAELETRIRVQKEYEAAVGGETS